MTVSDVETKPEAATPKRDLRRMLAEVRALGFLGTLRTVFGRRHSSNGLVQFARYGFVGVAAAIADTGTLLVLTDLGVHYLVGGIAGFCIGTIVNYLISVAWVFKASDRRGVEISGFVIIGVLGLGLNEVVLWLAHDLLGATVLWAKILAIAAGFLWNFFLRRVLFQRLSKGPARAAG